MAFGSGLRKKENKEMKNVRHLVFAALVLLLAVPAWAYDFEVDGICYNITSNDAPYKVSVT